MWVYMGYGQPLRVVLTTLRVPQTKYSHINPLLLCNTENAEGVDENESLEQEMRSFINDRISKGLADDISVYVINYNTGQWSGVNENDAYDPASMLKVPTMMAYYYQAQHDPAVLTQKLALKDDAAANSNEYFKGKSLPSGEYTIDALIRSMIVESDNGAATTLVTHLNTDAQLKVYEDLGLPTPFPRSVINFLSAKRYAFFFRVLYDATYLDRDYSEKALSLLTEPDIGGIRAGVPAEVEVAQKFGERTVQDQNGNRIDRELHDCGIVYKKDAPYLICIMSKGLKNDFPTLLSNIKDLSALVYSRI